MKTKPIILFAFILTISFISCQKSYLTDTTENKHAGYKQSENEILTLSYDIYIYRDYEADFSTLTELELSYLNPSEEKQRIEMTLLNSGQINVTLENIAFENTINLPHHAPQNTTSRVSKTVIIGSSVLFYDAKGRILAQESFPAGIFNEMAEHIQALRRTHSSSDINRILANMQGHFFIDNLNRFIENAAENGIEVIEHNDHLVTLRAYFNRFDPQAEGSSVILIDKTKNRLLGIRIYDSGNTLIQSVVYGYNRGERETLNAIKIEQNEELVNGTVVKLINYIKIDNLEFSVNI
ncbi:MAG: hypothetical protein IPM52_09715 [Bacteroidetes bacterium]|nr:hypothetical protein [Bacteroidota bacterium]